MNMARNFAPLIAAVLLGWTSAPARAQETAVIEQQEREISSSVLSPFCPGRALNDCPSSAATELRNDIREMLAGGKQKDEIMGQLFSTYGEDIRALPKREGFGLIGWIMPALFLFLGASFLAIWLHSRKQASASGSAQPTIDPALQARIDAELKKS